MKKFLLTAVCLLLLTGCASEDALYYLPEEDETAPAGTDAFTPLPHQLGAAPFEYTETGDRPAANPGNAGRQSMFKYSDEYLYFYGETIHRYNPKTGNITCLCSDPLCRHGTECPFFGMNPVRSLYVHNNQVNYEQFGYIPVEGVNGTEYEPVERKMRFDIEKQTAEIVFDYIRDGIEYSGGRAVDDYYAGEYYYYLHHVLDEKDRLNYEMRRENLDTGKIEVLTQLGNIPAVIHYADAEWVYYMHGSEILRMKTETPDAAEKLTDMIVQDAACDGENFYYRIREDGVDRIYRSDMNLENRECLIDENVSFMYLTEQYLYYVPVQTVRIGERDVKCANDIYRWSKADGTAECVYSLPEDMREASYAIGYSFTVCGNYIYAGYMRYDEAEREIAESGGSDRTEYLRINIETGDLYYITYGTPG